MFLPMGVGVNGEGHLTVGGMDTVALAEQYGTPLYVMNEEVIRAMLREFKRSIEDHYENGGMVAFASKACAFKHMFRIVAEEGCGVDVSSGGELYTALKAGFPAERIVMHGSCKTEDEIALALKHGVGRIVINDGCELRRVVRVATRLQKQAHVYLRVTPGIDAHTHSAVMTGQIDSKFGFTLENGEAMQAVKEAIAEPLLSLEGLHCHVASQVFDEQPFRDAARVMLTFLRDIRTETGVTLKELDVGGGFGVPYTAADDAKPCTEYMKWTADAVHDYAASLDFPLPRILIEPGRAVVAHAGVTLYTVGSIKEIPNVRKYVCVNGGMCDNPRYALYQADYTVCIAERAGEEPSERVTVAGRCCESGDLIQENTLLQPCAEGDTLAVLCTGAYNYSMSSNYNRYPKPPVVMVREGETFVAVRGETYDDVLRNDC